ncbi:MAG TPA: hypothetical protein VIK83_01610, partial [Coriobacteriia bacterium]
MLGKHLGAMVGLEIRTATYADVAALQVFAGRLLSEDLPGIFTRPLPSLEDEREFVRSRTYPDN